jgi:phosphoribosylglycinamide formyltransferase 1
VAHGTNCRWRPRRALPLTCSRLASKTARVSAAIFVSGGGTNLQAFIDETRAGTLKLDLAVVVSNNPDAKALPRARNAGIPTECVANAAYPERARFDEALAATVDRYRPDLLILAGFMRILSGAFVSRYEGRILNIHPSLLPRFPGRNTHQRVLDAGDPVHGSTVHFVTEELDAGPPIMQGRLPVLPHDTAESLAQRVLAIEHKIYPATAALFAAGRLEHRSGAAWLDGQRLAEPLQFSAPSAVSRLDS